MGRATISPGKLARFSGSCPVSEAGLSPSWQATAESAAARQNWALLTIAVAVNAALLWAASHAHSPLLAISAALLFAFSNNTVFGLLHEAVHGHFDSDPVRNRAAGWLCAAFFPTSFTLQRSAHLTHHRNNRSALERFDYIGADEAIPLKTAQWFSILTGLYWLGIPVFLLFYSLAAEIVPWRRLVRAESGFSRQTSANEFLESLMRLQVWRVRTEFAFSLAVQFTLAWLLGLSLCGWALCYGAFALAWSSLQYADHAFSPLDRVEGSWNLRVSDFTRRMFLNYHYHLEHHRDPDCRWQDLPSRARPEDRPQRFLSILLLMWQGPRLLPNSSQGEARQRLLDRCVVAAHVLVFGAVFELIYGLASRDFLTRTSFFDVSLPIDRLMPFIPEWSAAYVTITPLLLVTAILLGTPQRSLPVLGALVFEVIVAGSCFVAFPVAPPQPPQVAMGPVVSWFFALADAINLEGNCMPSLHVALALSCAWAADGPTRMPVRLVMWAWALAITVSTVLTWQHWVLDVAGGALLAALGMAVIRPWLARALAAAEARIITRPAASA
jgi:fatty acid desaturase/membrane-associated phospholipid phosphatase